MAIEQPVSDDTSTLLLCARVGPDDLEAHLARTRRQRISMTFNAVMCRGLLETRYGLDAARKEEALL